MIQFNLLPQVKLDFLKAQRQRRLVFGVSFLATVAALVLLGGLYSVNALQKKHLDDLNKDITSQTNKLTGEPQIGKILTIQNQLSSLTTLHEAKPAAPSLFTYLNQITPTNITISVLNTDFGQQTMTITGASDTLSHVNQFVDTLKFTTYTTSSNKTATPAFTNVVLGTFALAQPQAGVKQTGPPASYTINLSYDKTIFDITQQVTLSVPTQVTTRSEVDQPTDLFVNTPAPTTTTTTTSGSTTSGGAH